MTHFSAQTVPAYADVLTDATTARVCLARLAELGALDVAEALGLIPYEGGRTDMKHGKPARLMRGGTR